MRFILYFFLASIIFALDRISKFFAVQYDQFPYFINHYLSFELTFNRGVSWGIGAHSSFMVFFIVSLITTMITVLLCWHAYCVYQKSNSILGHMCIIAGSLSNIIDRLLYGGVIDFILLSYKNYSWPVFNIADVAIVGGVFILVVLDETLERV